MRVRDRPRKRRAPQGHVPRVVANLPAGASGGSAAHDLRGRPGADRPARAGSGLVVDVNGVGYLVSATPSVHRLGDGEITIEVHTVVREDALQRYGFATADERELFELLLGVNGVGPKVALAIVSGSTP